MKEAGEGIDSGVLFRTGIQGMLGFLHFINWKAKLKWVLRKYSFYEDQIFL